MMYVWKGTISLDNFRKINIIKDNPAKHKKKPSIENLLGETIFLAMTRFLQKTFFLNDREPKNGILAEDKKARLIADFALDHTGDWGGAYQTQW